MPTPHRALLKTVCLCVEFLFACLCVFAAGNLAELGACLSRYQLQKVVMAPGITALASSEAP